MKRHILVTIFFLVCVIICAQENPFMGESWLMIKGYLDNESGNLEWRGIALNDLKFYPDNIIEIRDVDQSGLINSKRKTIDEYQLLALSNDKEFKLLIMEGISYSYIVLSSNRIMLISMGELFKKPDQIYFLLRADERDVMKWTLL
jgi:hypothetical protein